MPTTPPAKKLQIFNFALLASLWAVLFTQFWFEWNHNEQYGYGVFMPIIGLYLLYSRWNDRPTPRPLINNVVIFTCILAVLTIALFPIKVIFEANADWRMIAWAQALLTLFMTAIVVAFWGGLPWLKHFTLPFILFLFGVPWPTQIEVFTIQKLLGFVTLCTVEALNFAGVFAVQAGNLIRLPSGIVSMEEACSGVRSFQSSIMLGFYLGELFRLNLFKRLMLIGFGGIFAILFNIIRTVSLSFIAAYQSIEASLNWHDFASNSVFIACLSSLILLGFLLKSKGRINVPSATNTVDTPQWIPLKPTIFITLLLLLSEPFVYGWFHWRPPLPYEGYSWHVDWNQIEGLKENEMAYHIKDTLLYDVGAHTEWKTEGLYSWIAYYFHWHAPQGAQLAGFHGPDLCLPAAGWRMHEVGDKVSWQKDDVELIFSSFSFAGTRNLVYVFYCQWDQSHYPYHTKKGTMRRDRLISAWNGHLKKGKIVLQVIASGMPSLKDAEGDLIEFLNKAIVVVPPK